MTPTPHDSGWRYQPAQLVPQWDPARQRMVYMHPTQPTVQQHGPQETRMGCTLASAQEMCRLENIRLAQAEARAARQAQQRAAGTAWDALMDSCLDTVLARQRETEHRREGQRQRPQHTACTRRRTAMAYQKKKDITTADELVKAREADQTTQGLITGQFLMHNKGEQDGRTLFMIVGIVAVPHGAEWRDRHMYTVVSDSPAYLRLDMEPPQDLTDDWRIGGTADTMLTNPLWRI